MSTLEERLKLCKNCQHHKFDPACGIVCSLTHQKPTFEDKCYNYSASQVQMPENIKQITSKSSHSYHRVNSSAESILNIFSIILLVLGIIASISMIIAGIDVGTSIESTEDLAFLPIPKGLLLVVGGIIVLFATLIQWAIFKLFINISRNLFNLNYRMEEINEKMNR